MADRMATQTFCRNLGGKGSSGNRLVTKSELSTYGCKLVSNPSKSYANNQCVAEKDIMKAAIILAINVYTQTSTKKTWVALSSNSSVGTAITVKYYIEGVDEDEHFTQVISANSIQSSGSTFKTSSVYAVTFESISPTSFTYNGNQYEVVEGSHYRQ